MSELKTLKEVENAAGKDGIEDDLIIFRYDIRSEAIKWVKEYEAMKLPENIPKEVRDYGKDMTVDFIKHFFNIDDEDIICDECEIPSYKCPCLEVESDEVN